MKITITGKPKEIAALVDEIQERRSMRDETRKVNRLLQVLEEDPSRRPAKEDQSFSSPSG